jgi:hypothetical protein
MKLPIFHRTQWQHGRTWASKPLDRIAAYTSGITPQAQQGVAECQERCEEMYPDNPNEQLECFKQQCWS